VTVIQRFYYSAYPVLGCYSQFPLLDSSYGYYTTFPILDVFNEGHYLQFYSDILLPDISITRRFSVPEPILLAVE